MFGKPSGPELVLGFILFRVSNTMEGVNSTVCSAPISTASFLGGRVGCLPSSTVNTLAKNSLNLELNYQSLIDSSVYHKLLLGIVFIQIFGLILYCNTAMTIILVCFDRQKVV
jgi:hypothetical protein